MEIDSSRGFSLLGAGLVFLGLVTPIVNVSPYGALSLASLGGEGAEFATLFGVLAALGAGFGLARFRKSTLVVGLLIIASFFLLLANLQENVNRANTARMAKSGMKVPLLDTVHASYKPHLGLLLLVLGGVGFCCAVRDPRS